MFKICHFIFIQSLTISGASRQRREQKVGGWWGQQAKGKPQAADTTATPLITSLYQNHDD